MKRIWLFAFLLLAFAVPVWAAGDTWQNGGVDLHWATAGNWVGGSPPGDGDTATFDNAVLDLPDTGPGAVEIHFVFTGAFDFFGDTKSIYVDLLHSAGTIGDITVNNATGDIVPGADFGSTTCTLTAGGLSILASRTCTGDIVIGTNNSLGLWIENCTLAVAGGTVEMQAGTVLYLVGNAAILNPAEPMRIEEAGDHIIDFNGAQGDIYGGIDASSDGTARQVTITAAAGAGTNILQAGVTGDLDLGTDGAGGLADWSAVALFIQTGTVTMAADANVYRLTVISGELVGAAKTITADAGGFTFVDGTISGTLDVDLSAAAGAYAQMDGEIAAAAVLNVTAGDSGWAYTALTYGAGAALNLTIPLGKSVTSSWAAANTTGKHPNVILAGSWTPGAASNINTLAGDGTLDTTTAQVRLRSPNTNDFWTFTGNVAGAEGVYIRLGATRSNAALIDTNTSPLTLTSFQSHTMTLTGGVSCGDLIVASESNDYTTTVLNNGPLSCANLTLGTAATTTSGALTLASGQVHRATGNIIVAGTGTANAFTIGGRLILDGVFTGTGITTSVQGDGQIDCFGVGSVTDVTATGRRLVVRRAVDSVTGIPLRGWNGDSVPCTKVRFLPRKVIGSPGVN